MSEREELVTLEDVYEVICKFRKETGREPMMIHLTHHEIDGLNLEAREYLIAERERDLAERLCPDLLPPMSVHRDVTYGDYIFGVRVVPR